MSDVRFRNQIRADGVGRISFWEDEDGQTGCDFQIPLAPISDPLTDPNAPLDSRLFIDAVQFVDAEFEDSDELHGREITIEAPSEDDPFRHGSHYICSCHNPITVRTMRFEVVDREHMRATVDMIIHYDVHGLGNDLELRIPCVLYVEGGENES